VHTLPNLEQPQTAAACKQRKRARTKAKTASETHPELVTDVFTAALVLEMEASLAPAQKGNVAANETLAVYTRALSLYICARMGVHMYSCWCVEWFSRLMICVL
jgi:hypothetical protein